jgi:hypothetical protein
VTPLERGPETKQQAWESTFRPASGALHGLGSFYSRRPPSRTPLISLAEDGHHSRTALAPCGRHRMANTVDARNKCMLVVEVFPSRRIIA